jgi:hypothetical protein
MAQAQIEDFNIMSVENIRMLIMNHSYEVEKNKKLYQERLAARQEMQKNIDLVKKYRLMLRNKLSEECKNKKLQREASKLSKSKAVAVRKVVKRSLQKELDSSDKTVTTAAKRFKYVKSTGKIKHLEVPDEKLSCEDVKILENSAVKLNPRNAGPGYFLITRNNFKVFSPTYPTIEEFGYIRSMQMATKEEVEANYYMTFDDFLSLYKGDVDFVDMKPLEPCDSIEVKTEVKTECKVSEVENKQTEPENKHSEETSIFDPICRECEKLHGDCGGCFSK